MVGDSINQGQQCSSGDGSRLQIATLATSNGVSVTFVGPFGPAGTAPGGRHDAVGGAVITDLTSTLASVLSTYVPDIVMVLLGTNDVNAGSTATAAIGTNFDALIGVIRTYSATVDIMCDVLWSPTNSIPADVASGKAQEISVVNARISAGDRHLLLCDTSTFPLSGNMADAFHPNCAGYIVKGNLEWVVLRNLPTIFPMLWTTVTANIAQSKSAILP